MRASVSCFCLIGNLRVRYIVIESSTASSRGSDNILVWISRLMFAITRPYKENCCVKLVVSAICETCFLGVFVATCVLLFFGKNSNLPEKGRTCFLILVRVFLRVFAAFW